MSVIIRNFETSDVKQMLKIYRYYVEKTVISFEEHAPSEEVFKDRLCQIAKKYPILIAELNDTILGYAYAHAFRDFSAYDKVAEVTVYLDAKEYSKGLGTMLYQKLEKRLIEMDVEKTIACITNGNDKSRRFHEKSGYVFLAEFKKIGYKFNQWQDIVWLEKELVK